MSYRESSCVKTLTGNETLMLIFKRSSAASVCDIAEYRVSQAAQMNPYLMSSSCFKAKRNVIKSFEHNADYTTWTFHVTALLPFNVTAIFFLSEGFRPIGLSITPHFSLR